MSSGPSEERPFSYVKHLREIRDRIGKEIEHMTLEEAREWREAQRKQWSPEMRALWDGAKQARARRADQSAREDERADDSIRQNE